MTVLPKLRERVGPSIHIAVQRTDRIPRSGGGKFRHVVSKVKSPLTAP